jgi:heme exporter protein A
VTDATPPLRLAGADLACERGGRIVFSGLAFAVGAGEVLAVTGRNGAGKSSLLRLVAGLVPRTAGTLVLEGGDAETPLGEQMHYAGHADALKGALTAGENLIFWRDFYGSPWHEAEDALEMLGIGHLYDLPAAYLSAGQKRRLTLARLFVSRRPVWLLDEPTSALDVATQGLLAAQMRAHLAAGGMILAATHGDLGIEPTRRLEIGS